MKSFESTGLWYLPADPDTRVPGTVKFSQSDGIRLSLSGSLQKTFGLEDSLYPIICGAVSESPYGRFITLFNCFATNLRFGMPGTAVETIHADHGFAGTDFVESDKMPFDSAAFFFSSLAGWLNFSGLKHLPHSMGMGYTWKQPEHIAFKVGDATIYTAFEFSSKGGALGGLVTLQETPALMAGSFGNATIAEIDSRFFRPLSYLMTFASDGKSQIERYVLYRGVADSPSEHFDRLYTPAVKYEAKERQRAFDHFFTFKDVKERFEPFMQKWFSFVDEFKSFCSMFFSYGYEQHGFIETRFLFLVLAAECLVREGSTDDPILRSFEKLRKQFLETDELKQHPYAAFALPTATQMAMPTLFGKVVKQRWALISDVVGTTEDHFIETIFASFDFVNTRRKSDSHALSGASLYYLLERLKAVIKVCVLKQLDFADEDIMMIVSQSAQMSHVKSNDKPWS